MKKYSFLSILCLLSLNISVLNAQYFGRNKPRYGSFAFDVARTEHFDIYHYLKNKDVLQRYANWSEDWYRTHQSILHDTIRFKNPIILYNNHADFQQTNAIDGDISVGTGGVTEAFKNRVILPYANSNQQTYHVLGHEMVHAFQYNMIINGDSTSIQNLNNLPLWMVEGLAEYMSIGRFDPQTSMWMRDAVINNDIPTFKGLDNMSRYFPYRYGQAFWAYMTGQYGDQIIKPLFVNTAQIGLERAIMFNTISTTKDISEAWKKALVDYYTPFLRDKKEKPQGKLLIGDKKGGNMNISPVISPNGKYVIFLSEKNLFSLDLILADAQNGKILNTVSSQVKDGHLDDFNNLESSGTWSPDSKEFAFVGVKKGKNYLIIKNVFTGKTILETDIEGVPSFSQPTWSPKERKIVVSGLVEGQVDLYELDLKSRKVKQLTNDMYSELHPYYAADGSRIVFSTDEKSQLNGKNRGKWTHTLAILNLATNTTDHIPVFDKADNLNPVMDEKDNIYFMSDRDGFRNIYRYEMASEKVYQITDLLTGASGITFYSPAISIERSMARTRLVYSHYFNHKYSIYEAGEKDFINKEIAPDQMDFAPSMLPATNSGMEDYINRNLFTSDKNSQSTTVTSEKYKSKFKLDYLGNNGVGLSVGNNLQQGAGLAGGVEMLFSDMLGNHQLMSTVALNGEIFDMGGQVAYINRSKRLAWGAALARTPYRSGGYGYGGLDTLSFRTNSGPQKIPVEKYILQLQRFYDNAVSVFAQYPFSVTKRAEGGIGYNHYGFRVDNYNDYIDQFGEIIYQNREKQPSPKGFGVGNAYVALVGDNSYMGITSPLNGWRYRLGVDQTIGAYQFASLTADFRAYKYAKPFTFAARVMHYARYGSGAEQVGPLYIGQFFFMHGFDFNTLDKTFGADYGSIVDRMVGTQIGLVNAEIRLPFTGPKRLSLISSRFLLTEIVGFLDGGAAWRQYNDFNDANKQLRPFPVFSAGFGLRVNVFGYMVIEPYFARPIAKDVTKKWVFGFNFLPGW
jgi:hypothetical protein